MIRLCILGAALSLGGKGYAQLSAYQLQLYDNAQGIRPGSMLGVTRDADGYLWILYPRFVQRFDGRQATRFNLDGYLEQIFADRRGRIWLTSSTGTFRFRKEANVFAPMAVMPDDSVDVRGRIVEDHRGRVLLLTGQAIFQYDEHADHFVPWEERMPLRPPYGIRSADFREGRLYISGRGGQLFRIDVVTGRIDSVVVPRMRRIHWMTGDSLLASSWDLESYWIDFGNKTARPVRLPGSLTGALTPTVSIRSVSAIGADEFMIVAREGVFTYAMQTGIWTPAAFQLKGRPVDSRDFASEIITDTDANIWLVTPEGLYRTGDPDKGFALLRFRGVGSQLPAGIDNIRALARAGDGRIWAATGNGFVAFDPATGESKVHLPEEGRTDRLAFPSVRSLAVDERYVILGPADLGIWLFDPARETYRRPVYADGETRRMSERDFFDHLCPLPSGGLLCMGRDAIYHLSGGDYILRKLDLPPGRENSNYAFVGRQGEIWVTTMQGLHLLHPDLSYDKPVPLPAGNQVILGGTMLQDGTFLFAAERGIKTARRVGDTVKVADYSLSLADKLITGLFRDGAGILWITCEDGIYRYEETTGRLHLYDHADNVQGYGFNSNVFLQVPDGFLYVGGLNGINVIRPSRFRVEPGPLQVHIQEVRTEGDSLLPLGVVAVLPFRDRALEVRFACPYFGSPDKLHYRYRLIGLDDGWKETGQQNAVRMTSLPPGDYALEVAASINRVDWVSGSDHYRFRILAPFWMRGWFVGGVTSAGLIALFLFVRSRNLRLTAKEEELEAEQAVNYFATRMTEYPSVDELLWDVARNCIGRLNFEDCVIYLTDPSRGTLVQRAAYGPKSPKPYYIESPLELPIGAGITGSVAATGKAEIIPDTTRDPRYIPDDRVRLSEIAVPIIAGGNVLGVIDCEHSRKQFFTQRHLSILTTIASLVAAKLVKAKAEADKKETERTLMETRQQLADIEMQALRAQMNPHFIFNCLNSINRYIVKSDQATASLYLTRFAKLIRLILDNSNSTSVTLSNELEALRLYIEMESIRFEKQFAWRIDLDEAVNPDLVYVPPLIIQPYVENAIWHGLLHKAEAGSLWIRIRQPDAQRLQCVIEDNGVGRARAQALKSKSVTGNKSLGMKLTEDRLALLSRHATWKASVEVEDLYDAAGAPSGTRVILSLPMDT